MVYTFVWPLGQNFGIV